MAWALQKKSVLCGFYINCSRFKRLKRHVWRKKIPIAKSCHLQDKWGNLNMKWVLDGIRKLLLIDLTMAMHCKNN